MVFAGGSHDRAMPREVPPGIATRTVHVLITHVGGPTALIEVGGWRLLTDPTFDAPGGKYKFGYGTGSRKTAGPAISAGDVGALDAVLLTHDHHDDNLDAAGRALLPAAGAVVTTASGATRLGGNARGLAPWESTTLEAERYGKNPNCRTVGPNSATTGVPTPVAMCMTPVSPEMSTSERRITAPVS